MKNLHFVAVTFFLFLTVSGFAQTTTDVVYLKNGSIIRGLIIEQVPNESLKIQTKDGSVFVYQISDVAKMTKEIDQASNTSRPQRVPKSLGASREGFVNHTALGFGLGAGNYKVEIESDIGLDRSEEKNEDLYLRLESVNGLWLANGILSLGLGLGLEYYTDSEIAQLPIFLDLRILPLAGSVSPVVIMQGGYSVGVLGVDNGIERIRYNGPQAAFGAGVHAELAAGSAFTAGLLYDWHQFNTSYTQFYGAYGDYGLKVKLNGGFVRLNVGITF